MKRIILVLLTLILAFVLAACGGKAEPEENTSEPESVVGGWEVNEDSVPAELPGKAQKAFDKAIEAFNGGELVPVAYIGRQLVAGNNYQILCKSTTVTAEPVTMLQVVTVYEDLEGKAEITNITDFNIADYNVEEVEEEKEPLMGGWEVPNVQSSAPIPGNVASAFEQAASQAGEELQPMAYLGKQIVSGSNYALLCYSKSEGKDAGSAIKVVIVYEDLEGKAMINNIHSVDPAEY